MSSSRAAPAARTAPAGSGRTRGAVASVIILAAGAVLFFSLVPRLPRFDAAPHRALGEVLGQEALKLQQPGGRVILITRDTETFRAPAFDAQMEGFQKFLRKAGVKIAATHVLKVDPLRVLAVPPGDFFELLRKSSEKDVIVSLLGPPVLPPAQLAKLAGNRARVLAVCSGAMPQQVDLRTLFGQKLIDIAILSRNDSPAPSGSGAFERHFKIITPANLAELPLPPGASPNR